MTQNLITLQRYSQNDPRWKNSILGIGKETIGNSGCLLACLASCASVYGAPGLDPNTLNLNMVKAGLFQGSLIVARLIGTVVPGMVFEPGWLSGIDQEIAAGRPVIIQVDYSSNPGIQTHYMVVIGKDAPDYLVFDPFPYPGADQISLSRSKYAEVAGSADPAKIITGVYFTSGSRQPANVPDSGVKASFPVYVIEDALALRSRPVIDDTTLIERYALGTQFTPLESDVATSQKIGVMGQWLLVSAQDGTRGYLAAWYVSKDQPGAAQGDQVSQVTIEEIVRRLSALEQWRRDVEGGE